MPVPVRIFGSGGQQADLVLQNTSNGQVIIAPVPFVVTGIQVNPRNDLITGSNNGSLDNIDFLTANSVWLTPNPAENILTVNVSSDISIERLAIYNTLGQLLTEASGDQIDVSELSSGLHFITIYSNEGTAVKQFLKK
jgi:hypothetical protein